MKVEIIASALCAIALISTATDAWKENVSIIKELKYLKMWLIMNFGLIMIVTWRL